MLSDKLYKYVCSKDSLRIIICSLLTGTTICKFQNFTIIRKYFANRKEEKYYTYDRLSQIISETYNFKIRTEKIYIYDGGLKTTNTITTIKQF